jgi:hypothetical protein
MSMEAITCACSLCSLYLSVDRIADVLRAKQGTQIVGYTVTLSSFLLHYFLASSLSVLPHFRL